MYSKHTKEATTAFYADFEKECRDLDAYFKGKIGTPKVEVILLLLPVSCKDELNTALDKRLKAYQE
jgi:hypothetical protein